MRRYRANAPAERRRRRDDGISLDFFFSYYSPFGYVDTLGWIDRPLSLYSLHTRVAYCCIRLTAEEWQWFPLHWRWAEDNNLLRHNLLSLMNSVFVHLHLGILNERILYLFFPLDGIERKKKHPPFNADEKFEAWKKEFSEIFLKWRKFVSFFPPSIKVMLLSVYVGGFIMESAAARVHKDKEEKDWNCGRE